MEIKCPKCQGDQLSANKKGFSAGKALGGALITGGIGLAAGAIGSNKIVVTCLGCGHQFSPGGDFDAAKKKHERQLEANREAWKSPALWIFAIALFCFMLWIIL